MDKLKIASVFFFLLLISLSVVAATTDLTQNQGGTLNPNDTQAQQISQAQQVIQQYGQLSDKMDLFMQKNVDNMQVLATFQQQSLDEFKSQIIIYFVVLLIAQTGLFYAILTFLKSKRLL